MRNKVGDNYEECYLRISALEQALKAKEKYSHMLDDPDFKRVVMFITRNTFKKNESKLVRHGFDIDDMKHIITLFGIMFMNSKNTGPTPKDRYYLMMRFMNQKLETFYTFMDRKFTIKESFGESSFDEKIFSVPAQDFYESKDETEIVDTKMSKKTKRLLKKELEQNIDEYADELQRIATSKYVDYNLRKAARNMCKKNNLNYIQWAESLINKNNLDRNDFVLEV